MLVKALVQVVYITRDEVEKLIREAESCTYESATNPECYIYYRTVQVVYITRDEVEKLIREAESCTYESATNPECYIYYPVQCKLN